MPHFRNGRARQRATLVALCSAVTGCSSLVYVAEHPEASRSATPAGDVRAELQRVEIDYLGNDHFTLSLHAPEATRMTSARMASGYSPPCTRGDEATLLHIDGHPRWDMAPVPLGGDHQVVIDFPYSKNRNLPGPAAIDLELLQGGETSCVRIPVQRGPEHDPGWKLQGDGSFGLGADAAVPLHHVAGIDAIIAMPLELGRWVGPIRLAAQPGLIGALTCNDSVCSRGADHKTKAGIVLPFGGSATYYFPSSGLFLSGLELRLRENVAWVPADTGTERIWIHSPELVFHAGLTAPELTGSLPGGPRIVAIDLEALAGLWLLKERDEVVAAPVLGGGVIVRTWL